MSHFYGTAQGGRGRASRAGHKNTGMTVVAKNWHASITVRLFVNARTKEDWASVALSDMQGGHINLYHGPLNQYRDPRGKRIPIGSDVE